MCIRDRDGGEKIVAPLACFLRIDRKAVKSSGRIQSNPVDWTEYGKTRRVLRIASAVPGIEWDVVRIWTFAAADVAARATGLDIGLLMFTPSGQVLNLAEVAESMSEQKRLALLRHSIRLLRRDAKQGLAAIRSGAVSYTHLDVYKRQHLDTGARLAASSAQPR